MYEYIASALHTGEKRQEGLSCQFSSGRFSSYTKYPKAYARYIGVKMVSIFQNSFHTQLRFNTARKCETATAGSVICLYYNRLAVPVSSVQSNFEFMRLDCLCICL